MPGDMDAHYGSRNPLVRYIFDRRLREIEQLLPSGHGLKLLDAGCGQGHFLQRVRERGWQLFGVEMVESNVAAARNRLPEATIEVGDLTKLPFADGTFDVVVCTEVIEHVPQYQAALSELKRVLKPGGSLILTFPNEPMCMVMRAAFLRPPRVPDHVNSFTPLRMIKLVGLPLQDSRNLPPGVPSPLNLINVLSFRKDQPPVPPPA